MKGLKKLVLATAVAAAPFAQAEMTAMDDALLGEMTGQAGVTIELSANVSVGSFVYTDTDGYVPHSLFELENTDTGAAAAAGTFSMNNIVLGGKNGTGALDDIKIDIDVDANDGLVIHLGGTNLMEVLTGTDTDLDGSLEAVDFGLSVGSVDVNSTTLASNIAINGNLGPIDVVIANDSTISVDAFFEVTSGGMDIDVLGLGLTNLKVGDDSSPIVSSATYSNAVATAQSLAVSQNAALITGAGQVAADAEAVTLGYTDDADLQANGTPAEIAQVDAVRAGNEAGAQAQVEATAIAGVSNMAYVGMTISTVDTGYFNLLSASDVAVTNALNITIDAMQMDITADVSLGDNGARELGSIAINDLDLSGTSLTIYGH
jgi:hypothetical protein